MRWMILLVTVLFGIVPATLTLLANILYYARGVSAIPGQGIQVTVEWGQVVALCLALVAGLIGYVALFFAARNRVSGRVAIALLIGVAAMAAAIGLELTPYWLGSPGVVGLAHAAGYLRASRTRRPR